jgi:hypothetical protein
MCPDRCRDGDDHSLWRVLGDFHSVRGAAKAAYQRHDHTEPKFLRLLHVQFPHDHPWVEGKDEIHENVVC